MQTLSLGERGGTGISDNVRTDTCIDGFGIPMQFSILPGAFALVAIAGYEKTDRSDFIPVAYGVTRRLVAGPAETVQAKVSVEFQLGNRVDISFANAPQLSAEKGPALYRSRLFVKSLRRYNRALATRAEHGCHARFPTRSRSSFRGPLPMRNSR
jgi:hypothetical protein